MKVLGIVYEHDATVCLMEAGKVTFCQGEERFNRVKESFGFPALTLRHVYERIAPPEAIDLAVVYETSLVGMQALASDGSYPSASREDGPHVPTLRERARSLVLESEWGWRWAERRRARREGDAAARARAEAHFAGLIGLEPGRIAYLDHHLSHAYSVLPNVREWGRALVFTLDGYGDGLSSTVSLLEDGRLTRLSACGERHSLGFYYADMTRILGMKDFEDEFKIMGLAGYARRADYAGLLAKLRQLLRIDGNGEWRSACTPERRLAELERACRGERFDAIAGAIQALTEELVTEWVRHWIARTGCRDVAAAGGVFMNVKASQKVAAMPEVGRLFVMPSAGDDSCAIGAAAWGSLRCDPGVALAPLADLYLGVEFTDEDIARALGETDAAARYAIERPGDVDLEVGRLLAANHIVGRFCGRMEFGARALGNRSILAHPGDPRNAARINDAIKCRDFWMPFAPSILEEDMPRYALGAERVFAPYMCIAFDGTDDAKRDLAAAMHPRDGTLRPQAIRRAWNPRYHALVSEFKSRTGIGAVLNTSFNLHGEPIVCSPADAIRAADLSALGHVAIGPFLLTKRGSA
ncbi:MAG: carbamoyltransferase C-terminal domain-containing protein [Usitatibacter sp.]